MVKFVMRTAIGCQIMRINFASTSKNINSRCNGLEYQKDLFLSRGIPETFVGDFL